MELRDFIVTPIVLLIVFSGAYMIRPYVTDSVTRRYFIPGLSVRIFGALAVGLIYQFYYSGGDTYAYHTHGSRIIWEAFMDSPSKGFNLLFAHGQHQPETFEYSRQIWYFRDQQSYFLIRIAAVIDLLTFSSYSATATIFAVLSFAGAWLFFRVFYDMLPEGHRWFAISSLFVPTVFFWGSGIYKDTLTLAALGASMFLVYRIFVNRQMNVLYLAMVILCVLVIFSVKKYILLCFLPVIMIWLFSRILLGIRSMALKIVVIPVSVVPVLALIYYILLVVGENDERYNVYSLAETAKMTAYDIRYGWGARTGEGSGYTLGELDGTWQSMLRLAVPAVNVSLFRPYLWEVRNPLMLMSAVESLCILLITLYTLKVCQWRVVRYITKPEVMLCLGFSVLFAFAVGVSTFNFGTLSRYKIPLIPFYLVGLGFLYHYSKRDRNLGATESTE